jgi:charged multivesicular body protein 2A
MANMNKQMNMPQIQKILHEFEKQSEVMDMKEEMINDAIDDAMEDEGDEEESGEDIIIYFHLVHTSNNPIFFWIRLDAVVMQVLDELGLQLNDQLSGLPEVIFHHRRILNVINLF